MTVKQAAEALQLSPHTIYDLIAQKKLRCHRLNDGPRATIRITPDQLGEFIHGSTYGVDR